MVAPALTTCSVTRLILSGALTPDRINTCPLENDMNSSLRQHSVRVGDREFPYRRPWDGRLLTAAGFLAFDTETEPVTDPAKVPVLALAAASAGDEANCVIHPGQVAAFLLAHRRARFVFHNV